MRKTLLAFTAIATLGALSPAFAADFGPGTVIAGTPSTTFLVSGDPFNGPVSAQYGRAGLSSGNFIDRYIFTIGQSGIGTGDLTTTFTTSDFVIDALNPTNLDLLGVTFWNGTQLFNIPITKVGNQETAGSGIGIPITAGAENILSVNYFSRGFGAYGGTLNFLPTQAAIPEPATWAMMMLGFGFVGGAMRRRRETTRARVNFDFA